MPRVLGIDPGTVSVDFCGLADGQVVLDRSWPTDDALRDPAALAAILDDHGPFDLVAGPSGYGLPLVAARDATPRDLRLACLAAEGESAGLGGLRRLMQALAAWPMPVVFTPGVIHLPTVPAHRKVNRVDMGTADKVCAVALALDERMAARGGDARDVSFVLLELGGAFSAALAVEAGAIVDGLGGTSGPMGLRAAGALDGEVAYLSGGITKARLFRGGVADVAGEPGLTAESLAGDADRRLVAREAYLESAVKAVAALRVSAPRAREVVLSGRVALVAGLRDLVVARLRRALPDLEVSVLIGFARQAKQGAQGAALLADGLAGGRCTPLVDVLGLRDARGTVLDHLYVVSPDEARAVLRLPE
jgi:predicted butyrate kinase (DUF1464 family)